MELGARNKRSSIADNLNSRPIFIIIIIILLLNSDKPQQFFPVLNFRLFSTFIVKNVQEVTGLNVFFHYFLNAILRFFDVLLTVHLSIFISVINQLDAQIFVLQ